MTTLYRFSIIDRFRVEGIENGPGIVGNYGAVANSKMLASFFVGSQKVNRMTLQRLSGMEFWRVFLELSRLDGHSYRKNELYTRYVLLTFVVKLTKLVQNLCQIEYPQMWIGSSLGIGYEMGATEDAVRCIDISAEDKEKRGLFVHRKLPEPFLKLFDWGRSEFNTAANHCRLSSGEKEMRIWQWRCYLQGLVRLLYQSARLFFASICLPSLAKHCHRNTRVPFYASKCCKSRSGNSAFSLRCRYCILRSSQQHAASDGPLAGSF